MRNAPSALTPESSTSRKVRLARMPILSKCFSRSDTNRFDHTGSALTFQTFFVTLLSPVRFIGPDKKGLMAGLTQLMFGCGCNILSSAQYVNEDGIFFQRMSIDFSNAYCGGENRESLELSIENMAKQYDLFSWTIDYVDDPHRVGILVSKIDHCLWDLLVRHANKVRRLCCHLSTVSAFPDSFSSNDAARYHRRIFVDMLPSKVSCSKLFHYCPTY